MKQSPTDNPDDLVDIEPETWNCDCLFPNVHPIETEYCEFCDTFRDEPANRSKNARMDNL